MKTKTVKIGKDIYTLTAVTCDVSGAIAIDLISNFAPLLTSILDGNIESLNKELRDSTSSEKIMRMCTELINFNLLEKNGNLIPDWKTEFECKPLTVFKLGYEALRFNCEDFFTFISGFVNESKIGESLKEVIQLLKTEGLEVPQILSFLSQSGEQTESQATKEE